MGDLHALRLAVWPLSAMAQTPQAAAIIEGPGQHTLHPTFAGVSVKVVDATGPIVADVVTDESGRFRVRT